MDANDLIGSIIESHENDEKDGIQVTQNLKIIPQLNYSGKMAKKAYRGYRKAKNAGRQYCGILDFKIVLSDRDTEHEKDMIGPSILSLTQEAVRRIHGGEDPLDLPDLSEEQREIACCLQAAFAEQEMNWGSENFQLWTRFGDSRAVDDVLRLSAPRDFLSVFLERCYHEIALGKSWGQVAAEVIFPFRSKSFEAGSNVLMPPIHKTKKTVLPEFRESMPPVIHGRRSNLWIFPHIQRIASFCDYKESNPAYLSTYA